MTDQPNGTELSAGDRTKQRLLQVAVDIAKAGGLESVTHKTVATAAAVSSSVVTYHFGTAPELRRAVALELLGMLSLPQWGDIEFWVRGRLPENHPDHQPDQDDDSDVVHAEIYPEIDIVVAEAFIWLARNGVTDDD